MVHRSATNKIKLSGCKNLTKPIFYGAQILGNFFLGKGIVSGVGGCSSGQLQSSELWDHG